MIESLPEIDAAARPVAVDRPSLQPLLLPMRSLLLDHRAVDDPGWTVVANLLASACFGSRHLWQDLGATGREEVTGLMATGFPALHDSNHRHLRWKRHLFMCLGQRLGDEGLRRCE